MDFFANSYFTTTSTSDAPEQNSEPAPATPADSVVFLRAGCVIA